MQVASFQFDVRAEDPARNLARVEAALEEAARAGCALLALPEMWPTSFPLAGPPTPDDVAAAAAALARVAARAAELGVVVTGSAYAAGEAPGALPTNRLHAFEGGRDVLGYDKLHLFRPSGERQAFTAGALPPRVARTALGPLSGVICYDLRFPEPTRAAFRAGAELLVVAAQWPAPRIAHWRALCVARAIEGQCFVVAANRTGRARVGRRGKVLEFPGRSLVVSPQGDVLAEAGGGEELAVATLDRAEARRMRVRVPVAKDDRPETYSRWPR